MDREWLAFLLRAKRATYAGKGPEEAPSRPRSHDLSYQEGDLMAAFDRVLSGIPEMDTALDNIRLGDNVVWRVSKLSEFRLFVKPYVEQAIRDGRNIIYFRFASHEPLVEDCPEVKTIEVPLNHRFENFTMDIHNLIEREGFDAFYVFDCLSELEEAWVGDQSANSLMNGDFLRLKAGYNAYSWEGDVTGVVIQPRWRTL